MDHRRKHAGHRYLAEVDHEVGDAKLSSSHTPGTYRRSRLSAVALLSLGLLVLFVAIVILFHFSHVNKLESVPVKGATKQSVVLRRQDRERGADAQAARTAGVGGSYQEVSEGGLGDDDDDGAANDLPGDEGDGDDDGSANDEPIDKGEKDDDGSANDEPVDKGGKDDDGSANDEPIDKGEKDDDGSANDEPIDKGEKDDDGSANDEPVDKGGKDDDGSANDEPIDKGEKDEDEADGDTLAAASAGDGDNDDDGTQNDTPGNLDEDDDTEQDGHNTTVTTAASGGSGGGKAGTDHSGGIAHEDSTDPEVVDGITDYDDDGWDDLYVEVESGAEEDYEGDQDLVSDPAQKLLLEKHQQHQEEQQPKEMHQQQEQEQKQQQEKAKAERQAESKSASLDSNTAAAAGDPTAAAAQGADMSCGSLSRELLSQWAQNNTVLLTFTNSIMFHNFGATWLYHVRKAGIKYWVLAVADNETAKMVRSAGVDHCFVVHENEIDNTAAAFKWGSRSWQLHTWQKVLTVRHVHHLGFNVINSDLDVVWLRNPLEHFLV
ncbi:hypothetical protein Vretifemale_19257 [Volvox reticuliferus]|nr:hypothetical protein Vretifemale_19257 [Volvox reticuliferus]